MKQKLYRFLLSILRRLQAPPLKPNVEALMRENIELRRADAWRAKREDYMERVAELAEARQMTGAGPWIIGPATAQETDKILAEAAERFQESGRSTRLRENELPVNNGWWGELDLLLDTAEWRREINLSWLEFSRWGIQQIILVSRLYWLKNPLIQRGVNVAAAYVWGRGVEISSPNDAANAVLKEFLERNKTVMGHNALMDLERRKYIDGNIFWIFFADTVDKGKTNVRTIDATEIQEIITNPDDTDEPWLYLRCWTANTWDMDTGKVSPQTTRCWYPALRYKPDVRPATIRDFPVRWEAPVYHRRVGSVSKWRFGCPIVYAALDWAKTAKKYLEACYTTTQAHAQIAFEMTTKGGQAALAQAKLGLETTINASPGSSLYDTNPTAVNASVFASGPGTKLTPMQTRGAGGNPAEVKEYKIMVAIVLGIPPTFLGDLETANLATATTLDRPTELGFYEKQEQWVEDLTEICTFVLENSLGAANGMLRESSKGVIQMVRGADRVWRKGRWMREANKQAPASTVEVVVNFPAIREGDIPALVEATVRSMTLNNTQGQVVGIDEKAGVGMLNQLLDIEHGDDILEAMYPDYDAERDMTPDPVLPVVPPVVPPKA